MKRGRGERDERDERARRRDQARANRELENAVVSNNPTRVRQCLEIGGAQVNENLPRCGEPALLLSLSEGNFEVTQVTHTHTHTTHIVSHTHTYKF